MDNLYSSGGPQEPSLGGWYCLLHFLGLLLGQITNASLLQHPHDSKF